MLGGAVELAGPVGERNLYALHPRGRILALPRTRDGLIEQIGVALAAGNQLVIGEVSDLRQALAILPPRITARIECVADWRQAGPYAGALIEGDADVVAAALAGLSDLPGPIVLPQAASAGYRLDWLVEEVSTSINTTAAGGNASLMAVS